MSAYMAERMSMTISAVHHRGFYGACYIKDDGSLGAQMNLVASGKTFEELQENWAALIEANIRRAATDEKKG